MVSMRKKGFISIPTSNLCKPRYLEKELRRGRDKPRHTEKLKNYCWLAFRGKV